MLFSVGIALLGLLIATQPLTVLAVPRYYPDEYQVKCGEYSTGHKETLRDVHHWLWGHTQKRNVTTPAHSCTRHACIDTTGVYVCNDRNETLELHLQKDVGYYMELIMRRCCLMGEPFPHNGISGSLSSRHDYYIAIAFASCDVSPDNAILSKGPGDTWGPNGPCSFSPAVAWPFQQLPGSGWAPVRSFLRLGMTDESRDPGWD